MNQPWDKPLTLWQILSNLTQTEPVHTTYAPTTAEIFFNRISTSEHPAILYIRPYFELLGARVRLLSASLAQSSLALLSDFKVMWEEYALGDGNGEKVFAVGLGYAVVGIALAIYLNVLTVGSVKSAGRAVRSAVRQQLLVVKVRRFPLPIP